jgi:UDP-N-acetylglucosamine 2-epimerase (non-hydrolysing)
MVYVVLGTKAQLIKMAPVMLEMRSAGVGYRLISTGQHRETMDDLLANFGLPDPDYRLYDGRDITSVLAMSLWVMRILWRTLRRRREIFDSEANGIVLVHGDTFSTLLGALMGRVAGLAVGHVESGLRSFYLFHPFPEEAIRLATFRLSHVLFCPGAWAVANVADLRAEKVDTGSNTLADSLRRAVAAADVRGVDIPTEPFALVTLHRFENIYSRPALARVVGIVERIARSRRLLFILHPPTEKKLRELDLYQRLAAIPSVELRQRYDYVRFIKLLSAADFVVSDGGSNQEECFYLGKPILLLRKATERKEGLGENCVLSSYDPDVIGRFVAGWADYRRPTRFPAYSASELIVERCMEYA